MSNYKGRISDLAKKPEIAKRIAEHIADGNFAKDACALEGVGAATFHTWLAKGRAQKKGFYRDFADLIEGAETERRKRLLGKVSKAANEPKHWQAATWILTHTDPDLFTPNIRVHVTQQLDAALDRLAQEFANEPEVLARALAAIAGGAAKPVGDGLRAVEGIAHGIGEGEAAGRGSVDPASAE